MTGWRGRRVLVTGADGFIGSHLVERLLVEGARVRAFCCYNSRGSWGWLDGLEGALRRDLDVRLGDVRDVRFVEGTCHDIEVVFHLAALIAIPYSYVAPESFVQTNVLGTLNVLEGVRRCHCARLVHTSTSEVYGTPDELPIRETHRLKAQSPYSASKIAADKLCEAYACSFGAPVVILRPFNVYGPRQSARAVLPTILTQLLRGADAVRLGNMAPKRDLTFVTDAVDGFLRAGATPDLERAEVIQLGTGRALSVQEIFDAAARLVGRSAAVVQEAERTRPDASEVMVLVSDPTRARQRLGWEPKTSLEEGMRQTAEWIRTRLDTYPLGYQV